MSLPLRAQAALALAGVLQQKTSLTLPADGRLSPQDKALMQELCFGVCRYFHRLQPVLQHLLAKPLKAKDSDVQALLLLGLYQLLFTRIPDHAVLNATVEAAVALKKPWAKGLLNAVLRNAQRQRTLFDDDWARHQGASTQESSHDAYRFSHPDWLIQRLQRAWPDHWQAALTANNERPPMTLRVNRSRGTRSDYLDALAQAGLAAQATAFSTDGITLTVPAPVQQLPGFAEGLVSVQDEAAQLAASLLDPTPGQRVLDACCAPGGKTGHLLELCPQVRELVALDQDPARMVRVADNLARLQTQANLKVADAAALDDWWDGQPFDRILLDAPCSATGVVRRHPDIKLLRRDSDIAKLVQLQGQLLRRLWSTLAPGGRLVYATCSVLPDENEQLIAAFVAQQTDARHQPLAVTWGLERPFGRQLLPQAGGGDGFYYAVLTKPQSVD